MSEQTTPPPLYYTGIPSSVERRPDPCLSPEKSTYRTAALRATRLWPGPVGELVARELRAYDEFGWRLANDSLLTRVRDKIAEEWLKRPAA